jgi:hypothetical protein
MADDDYTRETKKSWDKRSIRRYTDADEDRARSIVEFAYSHPDRSRQQNVDHDLYDPTEVLVNIAQGLDEEESIEVNLGQLEYALRSHGSGLEPEQQILE